MGDKSLVKKIIDKVKNSLLVRIALFASVSTGLNTILFSKIDKKDQICNQENIEPYESEVVDTTAMYDIEKESLLFEKIVEKAQYAKDVIEKFRYEANTLNSLEYTVELMKINAIEKFIENNNNNNTFKSLEISSNRFFTAEELQNISPCDDANKIMNKARRSVKRGSNIHSEPTYCLAQTRRNLYAIGVELSWKTHAYQVADDFANNAKFVEVKCNPKDFKYLPDATIIIWGKGTTSSGHIGIFEKDKKGGPGRDISDWAYTQRTSIYRTDGKRYGEPRVFMLKENVFSDSLANKLLLEKSIEEIERIANKDINCDSTVFTNNIQPKNLEKRNNDKIVNNLMLLAMNDKSR